MLPMNLLFLCVLALTLQGVPEPSNPPAPAPSPDSREKKIKSQKRSSKPNPTNPIQAPDGDTPLISEPELEVSAAKHANRAGDSNQEPTEKNESWINWDITFSAIVTFCTVVILIFTWWMHSISNEQLRLNERFFLIANRPRLRLRSLECEQFERTSKSSTRVLGERFCPKFRALVGIVNVGGTAAVPLLGYLHVRRSRHLSSTWEPVWKPLQCKNIEAREEAVITLHKPEWTPHERDNTIGPGHGFFLIGGIRYKDSLDREYVTNFCRDYSGGGGYRLMDHSQYEYED